MNTRRPTAGQKRRRISSFLLPGVLVCASVLIMILCLLYRPFSPEEALFHIRQTGIRLYEQMAEVTEQILYCFSPGVKAVSTLPAYSQEALPDTSSEQDVENAETLDTIYLSMLDTGAGPMLYYHQGDQRWGDILYGGQDPLNRYGCGPTAVAMLINSFTEYPVSPVDLAEWSSENGCYALHSGSYHSLIPRALDAYGLPAESVTDRSAEHVSELLSDGCLLIALMGPGSLTSNGHFVLFTKLLDNGRILIADPANYENCCIEWDLEQLLSELKKSYDSGGPLWAVRP